MMLAESQRVFIIKSQSRDQMMPDGLMRRNKIFEFAKDCAE
jgi:hypothetical protein